MISSFAVKRFWILVGAIVLTSIGLGLVVHRDPETGMSEAKVLGMGAVCMGTAEPCWLQLGFPTENGSEAEPPTGVLVVGLGGVGVVMIGLYGVGLLFATGQLAAGLITVCQVGVGLVFFLGQLAFGLTGLGQLAIGGLVAGQGRLGMDGEAFLRQLDRDVSQALRIGW